MLGSAILVAVTVANRRRCVLKDALKNWTVMTTVLQRIKDKRLSSAQECESREVFELVAEDSDIMTLMQLKMCLRALGFTVAKGEAQALVYEFDYTDTNTIDLADFQKIFLAKTLETSERDKFDQAFRSMACDAIDKVSIHELSSALHAAQLLGQTDETRSDEMTIDCNVLRHQMGSQCYDEEDVEAVQQFLDDASNTTTAEEVRVPKVALAAFLRV